MKIGNFDINTLNAMLVHTEIQPAALNSNYEWLTYSLIPFWTKASTGFKSIKTDIIFKAKTNDEAIQNISILSSKLLGPTDLKLDHHKNMYKVILIKEGAAARITTGAAVRKLSLEFVGYEYGDQQTETINRATSKTINVPGNALTPCIVEITPAIDIPDLTITGLGYDPQKDANQPIKFTKIQKGGQKVIVDGEKGLVTLADGTNKYGDTDLWLFPRLRPGTNTITVSCNNVDMTLRYCPRYI